MSAQANIVAFDGAATPVSHTLVPVSAAINEPGVLGANWEERITTLPMYAQVSVSVRQRMLKSGIWQVSTTVVVPVMESINGQNASGYTAAPQVAYKNTIVIHGYFHRRATLAERRLARQLALNIAGNITTSVAPVTSGPVPELVDQNILPS